jgi:SRSO17 transposase
MPHLRAPDTVLGLDKTGVLKKGHHSAGVARQSSGTAGPVQHGPIGVLLGYASQLGQALLDRELYRPAEWTNEHERCRKAGLPKERPFATAPQLARQMLAHAFAVDVPATWITGASVYGAERRLRMWRESQPQAYVLAILGKAYLWLGGPQRHVNTVVAALPAKGGRRLRAGEGAKGPRWYDWRWLPLAEPVDPRGRRWLLGRRSMHEPQELAALGFASP